LQKLMAGTVVHILPRQSSAIYAGVVLLVLCMFWPRASSSRVLTNSSSGATTDHSAQLAEPTGPFKIGTILYDWTDHSREEQWSANSPTGRELLVQLWYPTDDGGAHSLAPYVPDSERISSSLEKDWPKMPSVVTHSFWRAKPSNSQRRYPLLVFSHGMNSARFYYTGLMEELASHGYIVAAIDHTYWGPGVAFPSGRVVQFEEGMEARDQLNADEIDQMMWAGVSAMVTDEVFVERKMAELDSESTTSNLFHNRLNLSQVGAIGHSMGGYAATRACLEYSAFKACASLDGLNQYLYLRPVASLKPFLLLLNSTWGTQIVSQSLAKRYLAAWAAPLVFVVDGTKHNSFSDLPILSAISREKAPSDPIQAQKVIIAEVLRFFDQSFGRAGSQTPTESVPNGLTKVDLRGLAERKSTLSIATASAQNSPQENPRHTVVPIVEPRPEDVSTIDSIIKASYETISGPAGQPRQWGRDRTLYIENAYYVQTGVNRKTGKTIYRGMTYQEYADTAGPGLEKYGYFEREIGRSVQVFGHVANAMSAWEARTEANGKVIARGVNSIHLVTDGKRWWITSINWDEETPDNPIPRDLLTGDTGNTR
jgi:dienelactone hydrolase